MESGFFEEALGALDEALTQRPGDAELIRDRFYASGMSAYRRGAYDEALEALERWTDHEIPDDDRAFVSLAHGALEGLPALLTASADPAYEGRARALAEALGGSD